MITDATVRCRLSPAEQLTVPERPVTGALALFLACALLSGVACTDHSDLHNAVYDGDIKKTNQLLAAGLDVNAKNLYGMTVLMLAASKGHESIVPILLAAGADVNAGNNDGKTVLMMAAGRGHERIVQRLLVAGVDVNARSHRGLTALMSAATFGRGKVVQTLLAAGADVHARTDGGKTALIAARRKGHDDIVPILRDAAGTSAPGTTDSDGAQHSE